MTGRYLQAWCPYFVSFVSFLEKGGKALLLGSVFPVRCQTSFLKSHHDLT